MNIIITRPLIDSEDLMGKLLSLGHKIIHVPTLKISKAELDPIDSEKYNAFIFTSANAIRSLKLLKQDVDKYLKSDDEIIKLEQKVTYISSVVDYLDRTIKLISNRGFQIKNAIDWQKFTSGVV